MKLKLKLDKNSMQEFFFYHVEKVVLGLVGVLLLFFVYMGTRLEGIKEDVKNPVQLRELVDRAKKSVNNASNWDLMAPERQVQMDVRQQVEKKLQPIDAVAYRLPHRWDQANFPSLNARLDPKVYAPGNLTVVALHGPLAMGASKAGSGEMPGRTVLEDPFKGLRPVSASAQGASGMVNYGQPPANTKKGAVSKGGVPKGGEGSATKKKGGPPVRGPVDEYQMLEEGGLMPAHEMAMPQMGASGARSQSLRQDGFNPTGSANWKSAQAVVVQAVVPWDKQFEEFRRCLEAAQDFSLERDLPNYLGIMFERADVTQDPNADPAKLKWETPVDAARQNYTAIAARKETFTWAGFPAEVLDPDYLDKMLTHPAPPFMFRDLTASLIHPDVPRYDLELKKNQLQPQAQTEEEVVLDEVTGRPIAQKGGRNSPYGPGSGGEAGRRTLFQHMQSTDALTGPREGMSMSSGAPGGATIAKIEEAVRPYKLIRFTDTTVRPGRLYRYRVRVMLEDPNHPRQEAMDPSVTTLDEKVKTRLTEVAKKEKEINKRVYWLLSDWSEASPPIGLPNVEKFFAVKVTPAATQNIRDDRPPVVAREAKGKAVAVVWDSKRATDVPGVMDVMRGSAFNFTANAQVTHPVNLGQYQMEDFPFRADAVVADLRGGEPFSKRSKMIMPNEMLVFDQQGNWHWLDDTRDADGVERYILDKKLLEDVDPNAPPPKPNTATGPGAPPGVPSRG